MCISQSDKHNITEMKKKPLYHKFWWNYICLFVFFLVTWKSDFVVTNFACQFNLTRWLIYWTLNLWTLSWLVILYWQHWICFLFSWTFHFNEIQGFVISASIRYLRFSIYAKSLIYIFYWNGLSDIDLCNS